jgi:hypothetical protein
MINNFYRRDFYAFSSDVAGACTYGSDDMSKRNCTRYSFRVAFVLSMLALSRQRMCKGRRHEQAAGFGLYQSSEIPPRAAVLLVR